MMRDLTYNVTENAGGYFATLYKPKWFPYKVEIDGYGAFGFGEGEKNWCDEEIYEFLQKNDFFGVQIVGRPFNQIFFRSKDDAVKFKMLL